MHLSVADQRHPPNLVATPIYAWETERRFVTCAASRAPTLSSRGHARARCSATADPHAPSRSHADALKSFHHQRRRCASLENCFNPDRSFFKINQNKSVHRNRVSFFCFEFKRPMIMDGFERCSQHGQMVR